MKRIRSKRGRPPAGKKPFLIRMPEAAHEAMQQIADEHELSLGDWLTNLHLQGHSPRAETGDDADDLEYGRRRFKMLMVETSRLIEMLFEYVDYDPRIADDKSVARVWSRLEKNRKTLLQFLKHEYPAQYRRY